MEIRKISVGPDYKSGAMHYVVGQTVLTDKRIHTIIEDNLGSFHIHVANQDKEVTLWKKLVNMPVSVEYNMESIDIKP